MKKYFIFSFFALILSFTVTYNDFNIEKFFIIFTSCISLFTHTL